MRFRFRFWAMLATLACALLLAACGGDEGGGGGGATSGTEQTGATEGVKAVDPGAVQNAKGEITYCTGKDTSGDLKEAIEEFNKEGNGVTVKILEFPESADEQRNQFIQRQRAKSSECDAFESDVIWTAEFANNKWLLDVSDYVEQRKDEFIESTLATVQYDGKYFGVPRTTDSGFLYYRKDKVDQAPTTWQEVYDLAKSGDGIVYQGASYEGLTCNYLELAFAAGGKVLSDDGKSSEINSPENLKALEFMVNGVKDGAAPKSVTTFMEEQARRAFESGRATFHRNWPYAYALAKESKIAKDFAVMPLPEFDGGRAGILGGHNMVISAYSKNPEAALKFIDFATSPERITRNAVKYSKNPPLAAVYDSPEVQKAIPWWEEMRNGVEQAKSRPVSPVYPLVSQAIYKNVNAALSGSMTPQEALEKADADLKKALATF